jgi:hypothetical protein
VSGAVVAFLIWIAVGLLVGHMLAKRWYQVHQRWLLSVAEREAGRNLAGREQAPSRLYWQLVGSFRRGFGYRFVEADPDPEIELLRRQSFVALRSLRARLCLFAVGWLGGLLIFLTLLHSLR